MDGDGFAQHTWEDEEESVRREWGRGKGYHEDESRM